MRNLLALGFVCTFLLGSSASATLKPENVHVVDSRKSNDYQAEALFVGGDRAIDDVSIKEIRRAANPTGFDRIVIDLEGTRGGAPAAIPRPPYYQISTSADEQRVVVTIWGHPKLLFNGAKTLAKLKKSPALSSVELFPRLNEDSWTFSLGLKPKRAVEVFQLTNPVRIIIDIRNQSGQVD